MNNNTLLAFTILLAVILWFVLRIYTLVKAVFNKYDNLERLLFDIRDDTKSFHKERRESVRLYGEITAKVIDKDYKGSVEVINASHDGILLRSANNLYPGQVVALRIYLPLFPQPIDVKAKVARSVPHIDPEKPLAFDVAMEFAVISNIDREKLAETVDLLLEKQAKKA